LRSQVAFQHPLITVVLLTYYLAFSLKMVINYSIVSWVGRLVGKAPLIAYGMSSAALMITTVAVTVSITSYTSGSGFFDVHPVVPIMLRAGANIVVSCCVGGHDSLTLGITYISTLYPSGANG